MSEFKLKTNTHIVLKREDVMTLITADKALLLANIMQKIEDARFKLGKKIRQAYYVVNHDEFYAQDVLEVIKDGEMRKEKAVFDEELRFCRVCGCSQDHACPGGCYWLTDDLCSNCGYSIATCEGTIIDDKESYQITNGTAKILAEDITSEDIAEGFIYGYADALGLGSDDVELKPGDKIVNFVIFQRDESIKEYNFLKGSKTNG